MDERSVGRLRKCGCDAEEREDVREDVDGQKHFEKPEVVGMSRQQKQHLFGDCLD